MACADPQQVVIEHLLAPAGKRINAGVARPGRPGGPVPSAYSGEPYEARPDSIEIRKERGLEDRRLFAVAFDDLSGNRWSYLVAVEHDGDGWVAHGVAGGSDGRPRTNRRPPRPAPVSTRPPIHIVGQWGADRVYAGGELAPGSWRCMSSPSRSVRSPSSAAAARRGASRTGGQKVVSIRPSRRRMVRSRRPATCWS
jgi:hypothetical protein